LDDDGRRMAKHENNAVIVLLSVLFLILFVVMAFFLLRLMTVDAALRHNKREVDKAIILLREEREKFKSAQRIEGGKDDGKEAND
jgi:hypothetical protein